MKAIAIAVAKEQGTRSFELRAVLSLARHYQSTDRPVDAHAVLGPALGGFSPRSEMPEIAEAQALLTTLAEREEVKAGIAARQQRLHLQTSYGKAVMWSRGYAAEETRVAFARAQELAAGVGNAADRFDVYYSQWAGCMVRGEPNLARATAESFIRDAKSEGTLPDLAAAFRTAGRACLCQGDFPQAHAYLEDALRFCDPQWDGEARRRHGTDCEISATAYFAHVVWQFGEVERARQLIDGAISRAIELGHIPTSANAYAFKALLEMFRGDARATLRAAEALVELAGRNGLAWFLNLGNQMRGWARARLGDRDAGMREMREALEIFATQGCWGWFPHSLGRLAELEAEGQATDGALAHIAEALKLAQQSGEHWTDALLYRIRGDVLLKAHPEHTRPAEEAYLKALDITRQQQARTFSLCSALPLVKLYQSSGRAIEAHAVLAPALEGFSPTPEMPEIAEAEALLAALGETEEVKAAVIQRRRRLGLQTAYSQAVLWSKGWAASETKTAFERISDLALGAERPSERFPTLYGRSLWSLLRGDVRAGREIAEEFLREAEAEGRPADTGVAHRVLGLACTFQGDLAEARRHLELALEGYVRERDGEVREKFGQDTGVAARIFLAHVSWLSADLQRSRQLIEGGDTSNRRRRHVSETTLAWPNWRGRIAC